MRHLVASFNTYGRMICEYAGRAHATANVDFIVAEYIRLAHTFQVYTNKT